jgi:hypothetical protein
MKIGTALVLFALSLVITVWYVIWFLIAKAEIQGLQKDLKSIEWLSVGEDPHRDNIFTGEIILRNDSGKILKFEVIAKEDSTSKHKSKGDSAVLDKILDVAKPGSISYTGLKLIKLSNTTSEESLFKLAKNYGVKDNKVAESFAKTAFKKISSAPFKAFVALITVSGFVGVGEELVYPTFPKAGKILVAITVGLFVMIILGSFFNYIKG